MTVGDTIKRKAPEAAAGEPASKEQKVDGNAVEATSVELEKDAVADKRQKVTDGLVFHTPDTTMNLMPTLGGKVFTTLTDGGMQYLIAGGRGSLGVKKGRYVYEVRILEALTRIDGHAFGQQSRGPMPRQLLRLGFSVDKSPLILGDSEDHVYFDSEGMFSANKVRKPVSKKLIRDQTVAVVLNLDPNSPNKNTLSLFIDGERVSAPQPIPERLLGKPLYPHIAFRNITVQFNSGPSMLKALPFKCIPLGEAAKADVEIKPAVKPKDGKFELVLPVGYPDEGTFDYVDTFLAKNPHFTELSDRKIMEWAQSSGVWRPKSQNNWRTCNDSPEFNFGLPGMDDYSIQKLLNSVASCVPRHYVVMEVKNNLMESGRKSVLSRFPAAKFKKIAHVAMGKPDEEFQASEHQQMLKDKQERSDAAWRLKKAEQNRKKAAKERSAGDSSKSKQEDRKDEKPRQDDDEKMEDGTAEKVSKDDASKVEGKEGGEQKSASVDGDEEDLGEQPPKVELTDEDKAMYFRRKTTQDLVPKTFDQVFSDFTLPLAAEGFDVVHYAWDKNAAALDYLNKKIIDKKRNTRIESLQPSQWFVDKQKEWSLAYAELQKKQKDLKSNPQKQDVDEDAEKTRLSTEDIFAIEDIGQVVKDFAFEDWTLLQLRYELFLLQSSFRKDVNDPERGGIQEQLLSYYYSKYFNKRQLSTKAYGVDSFADVAKLVKDTVAWSDDGLTSALEGDDDGIAFEHLVRLCERARRERTRRLDAGDETARVKIMPPTSHRSDHQSSGSRWSNPPPPSRSNVRSGPGGVGGQRPSWGGPDRASGGKGDRWSANSGGDRRRR